MIANPGYGALDNMGIAFFVLAVILLVAKYGRGFLSNIAVLIGIIAGTALAFALGKADFAKVASAKISPRERTQFLDALRLGLTRSSYLSS